MFKLGLLSALVLSGAVFAFNNVQVNANPKPDPAPVAFISAKVPTIDSAPDAGINYVVYQRVSASKSSAALKIAHSGDKYIFTVVADAPNKVVGFDGCGLRKNNEIVYMNKYVVPFKDGVVLLQFDDVKDQISVAGGKGYCDNTGATLEGIYCRVEK